MEVYKLLDRLELLYDCVPQLADLRRAYIDKDLSSIFRLVENEELRKAVIEQNLHSIFRLLDNDVEELRKAVIEQNLHSIFRLLDDDDLRKLIVEDNLWKLWPVLDRYINTQFVAAFKNFFVNSVNIDDDCFSRGQIQSKKWIVDNLGDLDLGTVFICAGWYSTLATMIFESGIKVDKIRSFDLDESCVDIAEIFNKPQVVDDWRFKAVVDDIHNINYTTHRWRAWSNSKQEYSKYISDSPDTIINTSCEHIHNFKDWYDKIPTGKLVILQTNNYFEIEEHINCCKTLKDFENQTPMSQVYYSGELQLEKYTRYMRIGRKQ